MLRPAFTFLALIPLCGAQEAPAQMIREVDAHKLNQLAYMGPHTTAAATPTQWQFSTHNIAPGNGAQNKLIAADGSGNYFVVSTLSPQGSSSPVHVTRTVHVTKTDST